MQRYGILILVMVCSLIAKAQITANDSVSIAPGYTSTVFYGLSAGQKTTCSNSNWHIAVTVRATQFPSSPLGGTTIRLNEGNGTTVRYVPNADIAAFNTTLDTTGYKSWTKLHDSDTKLDEGALNTLRNTANLFDFGWGDYSSNTHNVTGDSLFLFELPNGDLKKLYIQDLVYDTAWIIQYANIDNTSPVTLTINKPDYAGKNFVYVNLETGAVEDKEPLSAYWDLQFTKYAATDVLPDTVYPVTGVLANKGRNIARAANVGDLINVNYAGYTPSTDMNEIGWNWKNYDNVNMVYTVQDSLAYFVWANGGSVYKIVFTEFGGPANGNIFFYRENVSGGTGIGNVLSADFVIAVFPNPAVNTINLAIETTENQLVNITITDLNGRQVMQTSAQAQQGAGLISVPVNNLPAGMYLLSATAGQLTNVSRIVVTH